MRFMLAALLFVSALPAFAEEFVFNSEAKDDVFVPAPNGGTQDPGAKILWNSDVTADDGQVLGNSAGECTRLDAAGAYLCHVVVYTKNGALVLSGRQEVEPKPSHWIVIGGSGAYFGARGAASSTPVDHRARFRYQVTLGD